MAIITESQLVLPALFLMAQKKDGIIYTSDLITKLEDVMHPTGIDAELLDNRNDTHFSQKVRNLKSHDTLTKPNFSEDVKGGFKITNEGRKYLNTHKDAIVYLLGDEFGYEDVKDALSAITRAKKVIPLEELVSEGLVKTRTVETRERSIKLRQIAVEYFSHNNMISCDCCGFNFPTFYGTNYGTDCIEIHHLKPIFQYEEDTILQSMERALDNLLPVCPNCHRVIHKKHIASSEINHFKKEIQSINPLII